jgi:hypothetical protein
MAGYAANAAVTQLGFRLVIQCISEDNRVFVRDMDALSPKAGAMTRLEQSSSTRKRPHSI